MAYGTHLGEVRLKLVLSHVFLFRPSLLGLLRAPSPLQQTGVKVKVKTKYNRHTLRLFTAYQHNSALITASQQCCRNLMEREIPFSRDFLHTNQNNNRYICIRSWCLYDLEKLYIFVNEHKTYTFYTHYQIYNLINEELHSQKLDRRF